jgi:hypothetical protein
MVTFEDFVQFHADQIGAAFGRESEQRRSLAAR